MLETIPSRKYRAKKRCELSAEDKDNIVRAYTQEYLSQKDVARRFRVNEMLVSNLVREARNKPEKFGEKKMREQQANRRRIGIMQTVAEM